MITLFVDYCNPISQKFYDDTISNLQFHQLTCTCGHCACLNIHGYYYRSIKSGDSKIRLHICRVKCSQCGRTHALLLSNIVPYSQISLCEQIDIISSFETNKDFSSIMEATPAIDEGNIRSIICQYLLHWKQKLLAESITLHPSALLTSLCFSIFSRQFMQIKHTPNILFPKTT